MTNAELAAYLNAELTLTGSARITPDVIRQWVLWDVLPRATGRGRGYARGVQWLRLDRDVRRARQLAEWRAAGISREQALIVHAFVAWGYHDRERVRAALLGEMKRSAAAIRKRTSSDLSFGDFVNVSATRKRAYRKQLGPLDYRFKRTQFELSPELYALSAQAMLRADFDRERLATLLTDTIEASNASSPIASDAFAALLVDATTGLFSSPDESDRSILSVIEKCTTRDLRVARLQLRNLQSYMFKPRSSTQMTAEFAELSATFRTLGKQVTFGHWLVTGLSAALNVVMARGNNE